MFFGRQGPVRHFGAAAVAGGNPQRLFESAAGLITGSSGLEFSRAKLGLFYQADQLEARF